MTRRGDYTENSAGGGVCCSVHGEDARRGQHEHARQQESSGANRARPEFVHDVRDGGMEYGGSGCKKKAEGRSGKAF